MRQLERAGTASIEIEDQNDPDLWGYFSGKQLVKVDRIRRPEAVRLARNVEGPEYAIERGRPYSDAVFVEALESVEELRQITNEISNVCYNQVIATDVVEQSSI